MPQDHFYALLFIFLGLILICVCGAVFQCRRRRQNAATDRSQLEFMPLYADGQDEDVDPEVDLELLRGVVASDATRLRVEQRRAKALNQEVHGLEAALEEKKRLLNQTSDLSELLTSRLRYATQQTALHSARGDTVPASVLRSARLKGLVMKGKRPHQSTPGSQAHYSSAATEMGEFDDIDLYEPSVSRQADLEYDSSSLTHATPSQQSTSRSSPQRYATPSRGRESSRVARKRPRNAGFNLRLERVNGSASLVSRPADTPSLHSSQPTLHPALALSSRGGPNDAVTTLYTPRQQQALVEHMQVLLVELLKAKEAQPHPHDHDAKRHVPDCPDQPVGASGAADAQSGNWLQIFLATLSAQRRSEVLALFGLATAETLTSSRGRSGLLSGRRRVPDDLLQDAGQSIHTLSGVCRALCTFVMLLSPKQLAKVRRRSKRVRKQVRTASGRGAGRPFASPSQRAGVECLLESSRGVRRTGMASGRGSASGRGVGAEGTGAGAGGKPLRDQYGWVVGQDEHAMPSATRLRAMYPGQHQQWAQRLQGNGASAGGADRDVLEAAVNSSPGPAQELERAGVLLASRSPRRRRHGEQAVLRALGSALKSPLPTQRATSPPQGYNDAGAGAHVSDGAVMISPPPEDPLSFSLAHDTADRAHQSHNTHTVPASEALMAQSLVRAADRVGGRPGGLADRLFSRQEAGLSMDRSHTANAKGMGAPPGPGGGRVHVVHDISDDETYSDEAADTHPDRYGNVDGKHGYHSALSHTSSKQYPDSPPPEIPHPMTPEPSAAQIAAPAMSTAGVMPAIPAPGHSQPIGFSHMNGSGGGGGGSDGGSGGGGGGSGSDGGSGGGGGDGSDMPSIPIPPSTHGAGYANMHAQGTLTHPAEDVVSDVMSSDAESTSTHALSAPGNSSSLHPSIPAPSADGRGSQTHTYSQGDVAYGSGLPTFPYITTSLRRARETQPKRNIIDASIKSAGVRRQDGGFEVDNISRRESSGAGVQVSNALIGSRTKHVDMMQVPTMKQYRQAQAARRKQRERRKKKKKQKTQSSHRQISPAKAGAVMPSQQVASPAWEVTASEASAVSTSDTDVIARLIGAGRGGSGNDRRTTTATTTRTHMPATSGNTNISSILQETMEQHGLIQPLENANGWQRGGTASVLPGSSAAPRSGGRRRAPKQKYFHLSPGAVSSGDGGGEGKRTQSRPQDNSGVPGGGEQGREQLVGGDGGGAMTSAAEDTDALLSRFLK